MNKFSKAWIPKNFILDVDGVFTDGKIYFSEKGKIFKVFGPDDHDALNLIKNEVQITVLTADQSGFGITQRRIEGEMGLDLHLIGAKERAEWVANRFDPITCVYMGDGIFDPLVFRIVRYSIAPKNASRKTQHEASFVTKSKGSEGAVAEASLHLLHRFFGGISKIG